MEKIDLESLINLEVLHSSGWVSEEIEVESEGLFTEKLIALASLLGIPTCTGISSNICEKLQPMDTQFARSHSLSKQFSKGGFPLHMDTAHWIIPCRYVILACISPGLGNRPTLLLDTENLPLGTDKRALLHDEPFRFVNGRNSFFGTILSSCRKFVRFDPGCMRPISDKGIHALDIFSKIHWELQIKKIHWSVGKILIIDNWRILHGRGTANCPDDERTLIRIAIK